MTKTSITQRHLINTLSKLRSIQARNEFKAYIQHDLVQRLSTPDHQTAALPVAWKWALAIIIGCLIAVPGAIQASQGSEPGDLLYPVKQIWQGVQDTFHKQAPIQQPPIPPKKNRTIEEESSQKVTPEQERQLYVPLDKPLHIQQATPSSMQKINDQDRKLQVDLRQPITPDVAPVIEPVTDTANQIVESLESVINEAPKTTGGIIDQLPLDEIEEEVSSIPLLKLSL